MFMSYFELFEQKKKFEKKLWKLKAQSSKGKSDVEMRIISEQIKEIEKIISNIDSILIT